LQVKSSKSVDIIRGHYTAVDMHRHHKGNAASPTHAVSEAMDKVNDKWGEFVITPALMMGMEDIILDRIAFGGVKELEEIYSSY
jgi:hypothetical protein